MRLHVFIKKKDYDASFYLIRSSWKDLLMKNNMSFLKYYKVVVQLSIKDSQNLTFDLLKLKSSKISTLKQRKTLKLTTLKSFFIIFKLFKLKKNRKIEIDKLKKEWWKYYNKVALRDFDLAINISNFLFLSHLARYLA